jgi:DNA-binding GntR family transcriptional regulator
VSQRPSESGSRSDPKIGAATETLQEQVYLAIKEAVMSGRFLPGQAISVRALAQLVGAGDMPTREAVKRLTSEGAFEALSNRTTRIPRPSVEELSQILELRLMLEGLAAEQAAKNISLKQIERLQTIQDRIDASTRAGRLQESLAANKQFHFELYRMAQNPPLFGLIQSLWLRTGPFVLMTGELLAENPARALSAARDRHVTLMDALKARDPESAKRELQADIFEPTRIPGYWEACERLSTAGIVGSTAPVAGVSDTARVRPSSGTK